jgi:hypothetical protein
MRKEINQFFAIATVFRFNMDRIRKKEIVNKVD